MDKKLWLIYKADGQSHIYTGDNEKSIKAILLENYQPFTIIQCVDYLTGELLDELPLNALYEK